MLTAFPILTDVIERNMIPKIVKGTRDIFGDEVAKFQRIEKAAQKLLKLYNFEEIRTPILESAELFFRGVGEETDIVGKEMYLLKDRRDQDLALRPEGTASIVRSVIKNSLLQLKRRQKLYYFGPMFRFERPQKGRYRQFHQLGVEVFGNSNPTAELEQILFLNQLFKELEIQNVQFKINTIGDNKEDCRIAYKKLLVSQLEDRKNELCEDCQRRLERNPLRIFDCKVESCQAIYDELPKISEHVSTEAKAHFDQFVSLLDAHGIEFQIDHKLVRGLDYYSRTVFEIHSGDLGAQSAAGGGGRYDSLFETYGEKAVPSVGFAVGLDRLLMMLPEEEVGRSLSFVVGREEELVTKLVQSLRSNEISSDFDPDFSSMKSQFKQADKLNAKFVVILGEDEIKEGNVSVKNLDSGEQSLISQDQLISFIQRS